MNILTALVPTWTDLDAAFHAPTLERGQRYVKEGRVVKVQAAPKEPGNDWIEATVTGSSAQTYQVRIELTPGTNQTIQIDARCTCPVHYHCKHAAAALIQHFGLAIPSSQPAHLTSTRPLAAHATHASNVPYAHQFWLAELEKIGRPEERPSPTPSHQLVVHVCASAYHQVSLQLLYGKFRPDGTLGNLKPANRDWGALQITPPQYMSGDDVDCVRRLEHACSKNTVERTLTRDIEALRTWVENGKAVIMQTRTQYTPLHWGPVRSAHGVWRFNARGAQYFDLLIEPCAHIFLVDGIGYFDTAHAQIGLVHVDIGNDLARVLLRAPPIDIQDIQKVSEQLHTALQHLPDDAPRPPMPQPLSTRTIKAKGVVHVRLDSEDDRLIAYVQVHYEHIATSLQNPAPQQLIDGELLRPTLNIPLHEKTFKQVKKSGLLYFNEVDNASRFIIYGEQYAFEFMQEHLPRWQKKGWVITFGPNFRWHLLDADTLSLDTELESNNDWFSVDLGIKVNGQRVSLLPIVTRLLQDHHFLATVYREDSDNTSERGIALRVDAQHIVTLPIARMRAIVRTLIELHHIDPNKPAALRLARTDAMRLQELADQGLKWNAPQSLLQLAQRLKDFTHIEPVATPDGLLAQLRPYQHAGLAWMQFLRAHELSGVLADDMGLGKTVQTIAHILTEKNAGRLRSPALVIAPTSVVHNWCSELARFAPQLKVLMLHGGQRSSHFDRMDQSDVVISSYPLLSRDIEVLEKQSFHMAIFDEAQYLKNARTRASEASTRLRANHHLALSGTPIENNLGELWALFHVLLPGFLGDSRRFTQLYRTPIERQGHAQRQNHLARRIKPFVLRRTKDMVAQELPPKTEIEHSIELDGAQRDLYETVRTAMEKRVRDALAAKGLAQSHIVVLDALLKLRQVCCDPRLVRTASAQKVKTSAKLERLMELLPELIAEGRCILLFSQFTSMLDLIEPLLKEAEIGFVRLTGDTKDRKTPVAQFQNGAVPLFLLSLKAGGTGLNLNRADTVIHYDPWWNPAAENQATDRAHRIGQDKPVFVHRLIAAGTVEERIRAMQKRKGDLARGILDEDAALAKALTAQDFEGLFQPITAAVNS